jgi:hypothetical protein
MIRDSYIIPLYTIMIPINANKYTEISLYTQRNLTCLGHPFVQVQELKTQKLGPFIA